MVQRDGTRVITPLKPGQRPQWEIQTTSLRICINSHYSPLKSDPLASLLFNLLSYAPHASNSRPPVSHHFTSIIVRSLSNTPPSLYSHSSLRSRHIGVPSFRPVLPSMVMCIFPACPLHSQNYGSVVRAAQFLISSASCTSQESCFP